MKTLPMTILLLTASQLAACVEPAPRFEKEFGQATRATLNAQIINPEAGNNSDTVSGLDGQAARDVIQNYQKSFLKPVPASNKNTISTGAGNK